jgi:hypothetical protein
MDIMGVLDVQMEHAPSGVLGKLRGLEMRYSDTCEYTYWMSGGLRLVRSPHQTMGFSVIAYGTKDVDKIAVVHCFPDNRSEPDGIGENEKQEMPGGGETG